MVYIAESSSLFPNLNYFLEERIYPVSILGGDRFCDWFSTVPSPTQLTTDYTFKMMRLSYELGVRGFEISCRYNLIDSFKRLKTRFPEAVGIGNPNWRCGYKLENTHLWDVKDRIILTIIKKFNQDKTLQKMLATIPQTHSLSRFLVKKETIPLTDHEIQQIHIDQDIWFDRINLLRGVADFCVIGSDYADWMCALNRLDLLRWQIKTVRDNGMIPVSVSHWASVTIPTLEKEDFAAHWIYANKIWMYLNPESASAAIRESAKPITAFKILSNIELPEEIESTICRLKKLGVRSFIVGLENPGQAISTLPRVMRALRCDN